MLIKRHVVSLTLIILGSSILVSCQWSNETSLPNTSSDIVNADEYFQYYDPEGTTDEEEREDRYDLGDTLVPQGTRYLPSANGLVWDINNVPGHVIDGGEGAFGNFGNLLMRVKDGGGTTVAGKTFLSGFDLEPQGEYLLAPGDNYAVAPVGDIAVTREIYAAPGTNYLRFFDCFTNTAGTLRQVESGWGGDVKSRAATTISRTSSGDLTVDANDTYWVSIESRSITSPHDPIFDPDGYATDPPIGYAFRAFDDTSFVRIGQRDTPFTNPWPGNGDDDFRHAYAFPVSPGETACLAYFLDREREEAVTPGTPPDNINFPRGSEIAKAEATVEHLAEEPNFSGIPLGTCIVNWPRSCDGIDIKPGSYKNPLNLTSDGVIPVAVPSTDEFDASTLDLTTVRLGTTPIATKRNGKLHANLEDLDGDGDLDLIAHFETQALVAAGDLTETTTELTLSGDYNGSVFEETTPVTIVPDVL
ncbi:MAG: hypothetical protein JSV66_18390 [Trueperaceae bacterium]|nr:MAG: hypothetical protein JSV66_18390 [Trueperaceae bacterium]